MTFRDTFLSLIIAFSIVSCKPNPTQDAAEVCACMHRITQNSTGPLAKLSTIKECYLLYDTNLKKYDNAAHLDAKAYVSKSRTCLGDEAFGLLLGH